MCSGTLVLSYFPLRHSFPLMGFFFGTSTNAAANSWGDIFREPKPIPRTARAETFFGPRIPRLLYVAGSRFMVRFLIWFFSRLQDDKKLGGGECGWIFRGKRAEESWYAAGVTVSGYQAPLDLRASGSSYEFSWIRRLSWLGRRDWDSELEQANES